MELIHELINPWDGISILHYLLMKLSLMPTWTCSGPTGCTWYPLILWYDDVVLIMWWTLLPALDDDLDTLDEVMESLEMGILHMVLCPWFLDEALVA